MNISEITEIATKPRQLRFGSDNCKCSVCGNYFKSTAGFDMHRVGEYSPVNDRRCLTIPQMLEQGMSLNRSGYWITQKWKFGS